MFRFIWVLMPTYRHGTHIAAHLLTGIPLTRAIFTLQLFSRPFPVAHTYGCEAGVRSSFSDSIVSLQPTLRLVCAITQRLLTKEVATPLLVFGTMISPNLHSWACSESVFSFPQH